MMSDEKLPKIIFSDFNHMREIRGADAARFDIFDEDGDSYWLWMSKADIRKNIMQFPHCREELEKGLKQYA